MSAVIADFPAVQGHVPGYAAVANATGMVARVVEGWEGPVTREVCLGLLRQPGSPGRQAR